MNTHDALRKLFVISISVVVAVVFVQMIFMVVISISGLLPENQILQYAILIVAIAISLGCGFFCYIKIYRYIYKTLQKM